MLSLCMKMLNEYSPTELTNAPNPRKWWVTVKMAIFGASSTLSPLVDIKVGSPCQQMGRPLCFRGISALNSAEIVFSNRILATLFQYWVLLLSVLALFLVCFWIWILMTEIKLMECSHFSTSRCSGTSP